jgi:hypothetical protein
LPAALTTAAAARGRIRHVHAPWTVDVSADLVVDGAMDVSATFVFDVDDSSVKGAATRCWGKAKGPRGHAGLSLYVGESSADVLVVLDAEVLE